VNGDDHFSLATLYFIILAAEDKVIADLFVHRSKRKKERQTLKQLLDRYGRMQCTEPRDRVFSLFSLASEVEDGKIDAITDYSIVALLSSLA
jgi:hypothetical protein